MDAISTRIETLLPQTQCRKCTYVSCQDYAQALINNKTTINRCRPGGEYVVQALARLLDRPALPPEDVSPPPGVAFITETDCIGCTLCIKACPADAVIGAAGQMHTVVSAWCTGCELCLEACPTGCIELITLSDIPEDWNAPTPSPSTLLWRKTRSGSAKKRFETLTARKNQEKAKKNMSPSLSLKAEKSLATPETAQGKPSEDSAKKDAIRAAMERARQKRAGLLTPEKTATSKSLRE